MNKKQSIYFYTNFDLLLFSFYAHSTISHIKIIPTFEIFPVCFRVYCFFKCAKLVKLSISTFILLYLPLNVNTRLRQTVWATFKNKKATIRRFLGVIRKAQGFPWSALLLIFSRAYCGWDRRQLLGGCPQPLV